MIMCPVHDDDYDDAMSMMLKSAIVMMMTMIESCRRRCVMSMCLSDISL